MATVNEIKTFVPPRNDLERQLAQIWEELLGVQPIGVRDDFFDLDGDSLLAVDLFEQIEQKFGKKLPISTLFQAGTVEALAQIISQGGDLASGKAVAVKQDKLKASWSSLVEIQPNGSKPPLFCVHPLGGGVLCYRELAMHLGAEQPVYGLQPKGLDGKQPPLTRVEEMASHYIQAIQAFQPQGPYFLAGYSFGGVVAFEMAQQLQRQGEQVGILVMIDTCRPGFIKRSPFLIRIFLHLNKVLQLGPGYIWHKAKGWNEWVMYHLTSHLKQQYQRYVDIAQHTLSITRNLSDTSEHLAVIDANVKALSEYAFQVYPGKMTLLRTEDQKRDDAVGVHYDPLFGWRDIITGELDVHYIPGNHLCVLQEPYVKVLAEKLKICLERT
jgi:thioesterase domain-containing protein/acyl carrier protein